MTPNLLQIAEGYMNLLRKGMGVADKEVEQLAELRFKTCKECTTNGAPTLRGVKCTLCGCDMEAKTRSLTAKCIIGKW